MDVEKIENLIKLYQALPPEIQFAVLWLMEHNEFVDYLLQGEKVTEKEIEDLIRKSVEAEDYLMVVVLVYKRVYDMLD